MRVLGKDQLHVKDVTFYQKECPVKPEKTVWRVLKKTGSNSKQY
jgi:hypothetical protein